MKNFYAELNKDLQIILEKLNQEKDIDKKNVLLRDKEKILQMLNLKSRKRKNRYEKKLDPSIVKKVLSDNKTNFICLKEFQLFYINLTRLSTLTKTFIEKGDSKLSKTYKRIISYGGIKTFNDNRFYDGNTRYIQSLDKNYIEILGKQSLSHYSTKIHELAHARVNSMCKSVVNNFIEVYPVFLELVFSENLKKNGLLKEAYNIKVSLLNEIKDYYAQLNKDLLVYQDDDVENYMDKVVFEYKYHLLKDIVLAFYLYDMYLMNPEETLIKMDFFILNLNKKTEDELLNIFGLDRTYLNDSKQLFKRIYEIIKIEKTVIMYDNPIYCYFNKKK